MLVYEAGSLGRVVRVRATVWRHGGRCRAHSAETTCRIIRWRESGVRAYPNGGNSFPLVPLPLPSSDLCRGCTAHIAVHGTAVLDQRWTQLWLGEPLALRVTTRAASQAAETAPPRKMARSRFSAWNRLRRPDRILDEARHTPGPHPPDAPVRHLRQHRLEVCLRRPPPNAKSEVIL